MNVSLYPTGEQAKDEGEASAEAESEPPVNRLALDPRCKPTSSLVLASSNSGVYMESSGGTATPLVELEAGEYIALVSTFSPQEADFVLTVYSAPAVAKVNHLP